MAKTLISGARYGGEIGSQASAQDRLTLQGDMYDGREDQQAGGITELAWRY